MIPVFVSRLSRLEQYTCFNSSVYGAAGLKQGKSISDLEHFAIEMLRGAEQGETSALLIRRFALTAKGAATAEEPQLQRLLAQSALRMKRAEMSRDLLLIFGAADFIGGLKRTARGIPSPFVLWFSVRPQHVQRVLFKRSKPSSRSAMRSWGSSKPMEKRSRVWAESSQRDTVRPGWLVRTRLS